VISKELNDYDKESKDIIIKYQSQSLNKIIKNQLTNLVSVGVKGDTTKEHKPYNIVKTTTLKSADQSKPAEKVEIPKVAAPVINFKDISQAKSNLIKSPSPIDKKNVNNPQDNTTNKKDATQQSRIQMLQNQLANKGLQLSKPTPSNKVEQGQNKTVNKGGTKNK
jgi:hypothetical protein